MVRKRKKTQPLVLGPFSAGDPERTLEIADSRFAPDEAALSKEFSLILESRIAALPERQRVCFVLKHQKRNEYARYS